jgi:predicted membrane metal-binding protein
MAHESFERDDDSKGSSNRSFGIVFAVVFAVIGLLPLIHGDSPRVWSLAISAAFGITAFLFPGVLTPLNKLWMRLGLLLHKVISPVVLGFLFFVVITPMGVVMRMFGKDPLRLRKNRDGRSYWVERTPPGPPQESFVDQF